ncbi:hypothetical protein LP422_07000 [Janibacter limosus]|uniref:Uncharacterized protein n=1 Tax=Janibacter limosus TaxID=53458 RepID=A0AC61U738_9MICO|nr:hypothetical protein [Janibacter limosus]UUZ45728.1 hypothetical protein LP422_07000 [Janibacter limosus]
MTIYKAIKPEAEDAAKAAIALGEGKKPEAKDDKDGVPSTLPGPGRRHQGHRQGHRRQGRLLQARGHLRGQRRQGLRLRRPQVTLS